MLSPRALLSMWHAAAIGQPLAANAKGSDDKLVSLGHGNSNRIAVMRSCLPDELLSGIALLGTGSQ